MRQIETCVDAYARDKCVFTVLLRGRRVVHSEERVEWLKSQGARLGIFRVASHAIVL